MKCPYDTCGLKEATRSNDWIDSVDCSVAKAHRCIQRKQQPNRWSVFMFVFFFHLCLSRKSKSNLNQNQLHKLISFPLKRASTLKTLCVHKCSHCHVVWIQERFLLTRNCVTELTWISECHTKLAITQELLHNKDTVPTKGFRRLTTSTALNKIQLTRDWRMNT